MSNIVQILDEIKKVYLNASADLSELQKRFSKELSVYDERYAPCSYYELARLFDRMSLDIRNGVKHKRETSRLQSKLRKQPIIPKKTQRANLRLVK